ncbi:hypothetical protein L7F22_062456 [Adiantum nelumboides]|nr:hypothetical protein [Adiantum nelumboides]
MAGNSRRYPAADVGCHTAGRDERFLAAQEGVLLKVPAAWFGDAWAAQSYGENHAEVFFFGVLEKYNTKSHKFTCIFEGDPKQYPATWDTIFEFVVRSSMQWNSPRRHKSMQVSRSSVLVISIPSVGESSHARGLEMLNFGVDDAHDAAELALDWTEFVCDVAEGASPDLEGKTYAHRGRGRPPKSRKRGRPKGSSMHGKEQCTNPSPKYSRATRPRHKKKSTMHAGGRPSTSSSPFAGENGDDDNDEHASEGEGVECGDDEALEAEGPVLDDTPDADLNFVGVVPPEWYFTSVKLLEHLRNEGQGGIGTYVSNRKNFPSKDMLHLGKLDYGASRFAYCKKQDLVACSWMDKKEIFFASNCFGMHKGEVKRMVGDGKKMLLPCPELAVRYNACKAGCDVFDSMLVNNAFQPYVCKRPVVEDVYNGHFLMRLHESASKYCVVCAAKRKKLISEKKEVVGSKPSRSKWGCGKCKKTMCADPCFKEYHAKAIVDFLYDGRSRVTRRKEAAPLCMRQVLWAASPLFCDSMRQVCDKFYGQPAL